MIIVTDILRDPLDEGAKVATFNLLLAGKKLFNLKIITLNSIPSNSLSDLSFSANKLLLNRRLLANIRRLDGPALLYVPEASITFASFIRARILKTFTGKRVAILSFQPRHYGWLQTKIITRFLRPASVITQSAKLSKKMIAMGIPSIHLPLGVDDEKFVGIDRAAKEMLREKYSLAKKAKILIHVGHIKRSRNLAWLIEIKQQMPDILVLVVGSTTTEADNELHTLLETHGVTVFRRYIPAIEEMYQLADYYVFPVLANDAAIETPLSVLEALATNLPVFTTRFGSLNSCFKENEHFHFVDSPDEVVAIINKGPAAACETRAMVKDFSWNAIACELFTFI